MVCDNMRGVGEPASCMFLGIESHNADTTAGDVKQQACKRMEMPQCLSRSFSNHFHC